VKLEAGLEDPLEDLLVMIDMTIGIVVLLPRLEIDVSTADNQGTGLEIVAMVIGVIVVTAVESRDTVSVIAVPQEVVPKVVQDHVQDLQKDHVVLLPGLDPVLVLPPLQNHVLNPSLNLNLNQNLAVVVVVVLVLSLVAVRDPLVRMRRKTKKKIKDLTPEVLRVRIIKKVLVVRLTRMVLQNLMVVPTTRNNRMHKSVNKFNFVLFIGYVHPLN